MTTLPYAETCTCTSLTRYACGHCRHDTCPECGRCAARGCFCHCTLGFVPSQSPVEGPMFFLGAPHARWLATLGVPLCLSRRTLVGRRSLPRAAESWLCDSGAFSEILEHGTWTVTPAQYARDLRRFHDECGRMSYAGPIDWMCEPQMLAKTGLSVREHQARTVGNWLDLMAIDPTLRVIPALQGDSVAAYVRCAERYERAGVDLAAQPLVGVGSVCRLKNTRKLSAIFATLAGAGLRLHGFGVSLDALPACASHLFSADSMAWSKWARHNPPLPGHEERHKACTTCPPWALQWRERVLEALRAPRQLEFSLGA